VLVRVVMLRDKGRRRSPEELRQCGALEGWITVGREPARRLPLGQWRYSALLLPQPGAVDPLAELHGIQLIRWEQRGLVLRGVEEHWRRRERTDYPKAWWITPLGGDRGWQRAVHNASPSSAFSSRSDPCATATRPRAATIRSSTSSAARWPTCHPSRCGAPASSDRSACDGDVHPARWWECRRACGRPVGNDSTGRARARRARAGQAPADDEQRNNARSETMAQLPTFRDAHRSQRNTCPPSAALRHCSIADITLSWPKLRWPC
jgi:hypothetical protein